MAKEPVTYREYYRRWIRAFRTDLFRLGKEQVIGAIVVILVLFFQWYYGLVPQNHGWQAIKSVGWPYLIILIVFLILSAVRAPVTLDRERRASANNMMAEKDRLQATISKERENAIKLTARINDLNNPKRSPAEEHSYKIAEAALKKLPPQTTEALRHLRNSGSLTFGMYLPVLPPGITAQQCQEIYNECEKERLVNGDRISKRGDTTYTIAPGMKAA